MDNDTEQQQNGPKENEPTLRQKIEEALSNYYGQFKRILKRPALHPLPTSIAIGLPIGLGLSFLFSSSALVWGGALLASSVITYGIVSYRNYLYTPPDPKLGPKDPLSESEQLIYNKGAKAAGSYWDWGNSFLDTEAWKNPVVFGKGMHDTMKKEEAQEIEKLNANKNKPKP